MAIVCRTDDRSDRHRRVFHRLITPHTRLCTEMVTTGAPLHGDVPRRLDFDAVEHPVALPLGGSGLFDLPRLTDTRWVPVDTPWGAPSDPVFLGRLGDARLAFLPRHGRGHRRPPGEVNCRAHIAALKQPGAAIATLPMIKLRFQGLPVDRSIHFGQPKVTNAAGAKAFGDLPLTRAVDEHGVVPRWAPLTLLGSLHGFCEHFGDEVLLLSGPHHADEPESVADAQTSSDCWRKPFGESVTEHGMESYPANRAGQRVNPVQAAYADRARYLA